MRSISFILIAIFLLSNIVELKAQSNVLDGVYIKEHTSERKVIAYTYLREADVMWSHRVWRKVDMREKINHIFYYPNGSIQGRKSLMQIIYEGVTQDGTITAYADDNEGDFTNVLTKTQVDQDLNTVDTITVETPEGTTETKIVQNKFDPSKVKAFKIKEDWFFDKQRSIMECRIIGIAPQMEIEKDGEVRLKTLFWIYFPEARIVFANAETYNRQNDAERRTYEDIFWKRQFNSFIYKETNVYDRKILEYRQGMDELLEAERAKNDIFTFEHDLWEY
jgi:gliding motility associated protien GldN